MAVFTGRRTRRQIIDAGLKKAGNTKILAEARVKLARMLEDLYVQHEWPFLYTEVAVTVTASTALPSDFLKVEESDTGLRGTAVDGTVDDWSIRIVQPTEWRRMAIPRDETADRPDFAMIDYANGVLKPWPIPEGTVTALLVYKYLPAEVDPGDATVFDANIPTFPYHGLLEDMVEEWALDYDHSPRAQVKRVENQAALSMVLGTAIPRDANKAADIPLDPSIFFTPARVNEE